MKKYASFLLSGLSIFFIGTVHAMEKTRPYIPNNELMEAIDQHDVVKARALLDAGADINHVGYTYKFQHPIHLINEQEYIPTIYFDITPLSLAANNGFEDMVTMLLDYESPNPLIARDGILKALLIAEQLKTDEKIDPDIAFPPEHTIGILKELFSKPLAIDKKNRHGRTALYSSNNLFRSSSFSIIQKIIDHGADINACDDDGNTPLMDAVEEHESEKAIILIKNKADLNIKNNTGLTALHRAAMHGYREIMDVLIAGGADETIKDPSGHTAWSLYLQEPSIYCWPDYIRP